MNICKQIRHLHLSQKDEILKKGGGEEGIMFHSEEPKAQTSYGTWGAPSSPTATVRGKLWQGSDTSLQQEAALKGTHGNTLGIR